MISRRLRSVSKGWWGRVIGVLLASTGPVAAVDVDCADGSGTVAVQCLDGTVATSCTSRTTSYISYYAVPSGSGPFPAVLYNHGGGGTALGGDPLENVGQLACSGYLAHAKRRVLGPIELSYELEAAVGLDELIALAGANLDPERVGVMGYSRGGLYALRMTELESGAFAAAVLMASAPGEGSWVDPGGDGSTSMDSYLSDVGMIDPDTDFLVMVAGNDHNDTSGNNPFNHLVDLSTTVHQTLIAQGLSSTLEIRPAWPPLNLTLPLGGHQLFESTDDGGQVLGLDEEHYWRKVIEHFDTHLALPPAVPMPRLGGLMLGACLVVVGIGVLRRGH